MTKELFDSTTDLRTLREVVKRGSVMVVKIIGLNEAFAECIRVLREFEVGKRTNGNIRFTSRPFQTVSIENDTMTVDEAIGYPVVYVRIEGSESMISFVDRVLTKAMEYNLSYSRIFID